jgi:hypothetical protein
MDYPNYYLLNGLDRSAKAETPLLSTSSTLSFELAANRILRRLDANAGGGRKEAGP